MRGEGLASGLWAGLAATGVMSLFMWAAQKTSGTGRLPPRKIMEAGLKAGGVELPKEGHLKALSTLAHFGFGGVSGAIYGVAEAKTKLPGVVSGTVFGLLVWMTSYKGWIPALGIMPRPEADRKARARTMVIAHVLYGACLGALVQRLKWRGPSRADLRKVKRLGQQRFLGT